MSDELTPGTLRRLAREFEERHQPGHVLGLFVAGSGLRLEIPGWRADAVVDLATVLPFPMKALPGHSHTLTLWRRGGETLLVMNGRFHLYQGYTPAEVVAPVRLAALLGAGIMVATNATGALDPGIAPGSLVIVTDHLNLQGQNPLVGVWAQEMGTPFPDMTEVYDPSLRKIAREESTAAGFAVHEGVYAAVLGPSFETPAEVRMLRQLGGTVVGMSTVPEVIAARQMEMRVLVLSLASNLAAGLSASPLTHEEVLEAGKSASGRLAGLMGRLAGRLFPEA